MNFINLPLHDAVLTAIYISWEANRCDLRVYTVGGNAHLLVFEGFSNLEFPKHEPWGASKSINSVREPATGSFEIELQSGDVIRISALKWSFRNE